MRKVILFYLVCVLSVATLSGQGQTPDVFYPDLSSDLILGFDDNGNAIYADGGVGNGSLYPLRTLEDRIVGPSPEVSGMMKYVDASMNYSDGSATLSVPLFRWTQGSIDMNLTLNYQIRG